MREYLFRGKQVGGNEWAEGCLIHTPKYCCILQDEEKVHPMDYPYLDNDTGCFDGYATPVMPETVGQYTGLTDKNGKKIFDGDIVKHYHDKRFPESYSKGMIFYDEEYLRWKRTSESGKLCVSNDCIYEVIGNIHDNPELLKGGEEQ